MKVRKLNAYQIRTNLWRCYGKHPITQNRKPYYGSTKNEAEEAARASFNDIVPSKNLSLAQYYFEYYLPTLLHKSENWKMQVCWAYDNYLIPSFGKNLLKEISRIQIQIFFNSITEKLSPSSLGRLKICLSAIFNLAVMDGILSVNPCSRIQLPTVSPTKVNILSFDELAKLFMAGDDLIKSFILIQFAGGLRVGECCGLMVADLSPTGKLSIQRQVQQLPGGAIISDELKTVSSRRVLLLPKELANMMIKHSAGSKFFLGNQRGVYGLPNNITRALDKTRKRIGMRKITCHQFRHTIISQLLLKGCPNAVVQQISGKSTQKGDVLGVYAHATDLEISKWIGILFNEFLENLVSNSTE